MDAAEPTQDNPEVGAEPSASVEVVETEVADEATTADDETKTAESSDNESSDGNDAEFEPSHQALAVAYRETRPGEVPEAAMFAAAAGLNVEAERVAHGMSHVGRVPHDGDGLDGQVVGVAMVCRSAEPPLKVALHAEDDGRSHGKTLLDLSLLKMRGQSGRVLRVQAPESVDGPLWKSTSWLDHLPDLQAQGSSDAWRCALADAPPTAVAVVERVLAKARASLNSLRDEDRPTPDASPDPSGD